MKLERATDPVGRAYDANLARIESSPEFVALMHQVASAYAVEDLTEKDARTDAVPADVREFAKRLVVDVLTCAHGASASPRAIGAMRALMQEAAERRNREGAGWWAVLTRLFRRPSDEVPEGAAIAIERGGYPDGFPRSVKKEVGYVLGVLRLNCPELGERLRVVSAAQLAALESALGTIATKWEAPGRRLSSWTMASMVASKWWKGGAGNKTEADRKPPLSVSTGAVSADRFGQWHGRLPGQAADREVLTHWSHGCKHSAHCFLKPQER